MMARLYEWWRTAFPKDTDSDPEFTELMDNASRFGEEQRQASIQAQKRILQQQDWRNISIQERFGASNNPNGGQRK